MVNLANAVVYDLETLPNVFTCSMELLHAPATMTWEISEYKDERAALINWLHHCRINQTPMIGFNSIHFDYPVIHFLYNNPHATVRQIYEKAMLVLRAKGDERFKHSIWADNRFAPQIDLFTINHFDNKSKMTSLKALQINMRSETVVDSPVEFGTDLTREQITNDLIPYNRHDVKETKRFAHINKQAIDFRVNLIDQFGLDVLNYNDTKIGSKILETKLGESLCYEWRDYYDDYGNLKRKRFARQTQRSFIALKDVIFPNVHFDHPEFQRVLAFLRAQILTPADIEDPDSPVQTKGVLTGLVAHVGGIDFKFGTGGIHGSVSKQRFVASDEWPIYDIDVAGMYTNVMVVNKLAPAHLGQAFVEVFSQIPEERKLHKKGTVPNATLKLAGNGAYGNTNSPHGPLRDPLVTMTTTINGQLMLCMLAEWLVTVPTLRLIQVNTDGVSYQVHRDYQPLAERMQRYWQDETRLVLEEVRYSHMWIADVNTYVARGIDGKLKQKGRLWHPTPNTAADPDAYARSISEAAPPAWHKDLGNVVSIRAAVMSMVNGIDAASWIRAHDDPFDFMCRAKVDRASKLMLGERQVQSTTRYYVAKEGAPLVKVSPPKGPDGWYKRANGVTEQQYNAVMAETSGGWDERVCTKNKSRYETRRMTIESGWQIAECNDVRSFDFANVNYDYYIAEAAKLIIV